MIALIAFLVCTAFVLYIIIGYPVLLTWMAPRYEKPVHKRHNQPSITVLVAAYNGEQYIGEKLDSLLELNYPKNRMEILVVSDGSTDGTEAIVRRYEGRGVRLLSIPRGGKPAALNAGIPATTGEILVLTDVRQVLEPDSVQRLMDCFADSAVGVVSGDLIIRRGNKSDQQDVGRYWDYERWIRKKLGGIDSMFGATGPFYAIRRELAVRVPPDMLLDDVYLPLAAFFKGYRLIVEEEARAYDYPTGLGTEFDRKVRTLAGNYQILRAYPKLLGPGNRLWFHFVSYKLGRLMIPYALMGIAVATVFLSGWLGKAAVVVQVLFYGMALLDLCVGQEASLKRVTSPCRTFVTLNAAAVMALSIFFVEPRKLWKVTSAGKMGSGG